MKNTEIANICQTALEDLKGQDIKTLDVSKLTDVTDTMILCTGTSNRHVKSLANNVVDAVKAQGIKPFGVEGEETAEWILIDLSDVVVHIMQKEAREFYDLESLWEMTAQTTLKARRNEL